ncbi:integrin alpha-9-like isoform X2 [Lytechinus variegatus]|uniref:integrin alpha-9-like isoform X2 n=1 Tax=Lytechinus variegatus TaxID=7654 RepID=UPI001BB17C70|nr:integrin alpha-9-like isoform X2 [Lytechinus variegatus]
MGNIRTILAFVSGLYLLVWNFELSWCFNVEQTLPVVYNRPGGSYFGYSVLLHENLQGKWVLVGAPKSYSQYQPTITRPGAIFKCNIPQIAGQRPICVEVKLDDRGNERSGPNVRPYFKDAKDNQWLGVSLTRQRNRRTAKVTACAHKWSNEFFKDTIKVILVNGACYEIDADLYFTSVNKTRPCLHEVQIKADTLGKGIAWHGWCQAGFSATYSMDGSTLILGAVGSLAWRGSVVSISSGATTVADTTNWYPPEDKDESYVGYAVSSGHFISTTSMEGVTGAPRAYEKGHVYIYNLQNFALITTIKGESMNTYFGAAVLGMDINHDGLTDLLVGAPQFSQDQDEGRVYIFVNDGNAIMRKMDVKLMGSNSIGARFGSVIESVGDLNADGYEDVAIGAPYEDNNRGAVYIYLGGENHLRKPYSQRLVAATNMVSFGSSISGGMDMDNNGYPDIAVGAYENDTAALFLSKPVIEMEAFLTLTPTLINTNHAECMLYGRPTTCLHLTACVRYTGASVPYRIGIDRMLEVDYYKVATGFPPRVVFFENGESMGSTIVQNIQLVKNQQTCHDIVAYFKRDMKDFLSPVPFRLSHELRISGNAPYITLCNRLCPTISPYSDNNIVQEATFMSNCGNDSICVTDLQLSASTIIPRGTKYLPLGSADNIYVMVDLMNQGEEAHQAQVLIEYPVGITFVRVESNRQQETIVLCSPLTTSNETASVLCDVDNPMKANSRSSFRVKLSVPTAHANSRSIDIVVSASTSSTEYNHTLYNNIQRIRVPIRIEADITISGVTRPNSVLYGLPESSNSNSQDSAINESQMDETLPLIPSEVNELNLDKHIGPAFKHIYDARNLGPSNLPFMTSVNITIPWKTKNGDMLIYFSNIDFKGTGVCETQAILAEQSTLLQRMLAKRNRTNPHEETHQSLASTLFGTNKNRRLNCMNSQCAVIECLVDNLESGDGAVIQLDMRIFEDTFLKGDFGKIELHAEGIIGVDDPLKRHIQPQSGRPDSVMVKTVIFTESSVRNRPVPKWVIAVSIAAGIVCLIAVILVMWKCGFFRRRMKEEMERLIQEKEEQESLNPEGILNEADYEDDNFRSY